MIKLQKYKSYLFVLILGILCFALGGVYFGGIYTIKYKHFDNTAPVLIDGSLFPKQQEFDISFKFRFDGFRETNKPELLFQTYTDNNSLSLFFNNNSSCPFCTKASKTISDIANSGSGFWAIIIDNPGFGYNQVIPLNSFPVEGVWYKADIRIKGKKLYVYLNGELNTKANITNKLSLTNVSVGGNRFGEEAFNGEIRNFRMSVSSYSKLIHKLLETALVLLFLWGIGLLWAKYFGKKISLKALWDKKWLDWHNLGEGIGLLVLISAGVKIFAQLDGYLVLKSGAFLLMLSVLGFAWKQAGLKRFAALIGCFGVFLWLKSYFLRISYSGLYADLLIFAALFAIVQWIARKRFCLILLRPLLTLGSFVFFTVLAVGACYVKMLKVRILAMNEMWAVFQSNPAEMWGFCTTFFSGPHFVYILFFALLAAVLFWRLFLPAEPKTNRRLFAGIQAALLAGAVLMTYIAGKSQSFVSPIAASIGDYKNTIGQFRKYQKIREENQNLLKASKAGKGETYVLVIGESSNPAHWSANGYFRDTTPWAAKIKKEGKALFFDNAYASYVHTVPALLKALTAANQYNRQNDFVSVTLPQIAKAAGFKVYWLSNQNKYSIVDNPLTVLAEMADVTRFTDAVSVDENLLPLLDEQLASLDKEQNNLIIIHMIGSHAPYLTRIPNDYRPEFASGEQELGNLAHNRNFVKNVLNPYDMTIKYTDGVLEQLYQKIVEKTGEPEAFVYVSDHGEDVYNGRFHNASQFTWEMSHIPMFAIFSENYKQKYARQYQTLKNSREKVFTLDCLYDTVLGIMNVKTREYDSDCDLSTPAYRINRENAVTLYTDKNLQTNLYAKTDPLPLEDDERYVIRRNVDYLNRQYPNRFVSNYTDAVAAANEAVANGFIGIEVNLSAPGLNMGHGPQRIYDITLDQYLNEVPQQKLVKIWLDMKELQEEDIDAVLAKLNELDKKYHLKSRVILESTLRSPKMKAFANAGWHTSYYFFPTEENKYLEKQKPNKEEQKKLKELAQTIAAEVKAQKSSAVSFYAMYYPFMKKYVEPLLPRNVVFHTWAIDGIPSIKDKSLILNPTWRENKIVRDPRVKTILISPESKFAITL